MFIDRMLSGAAPVTTRERVYELLIWKVVMETSSRFYRPFLRSGLKSG